MEGQPSKFWWQDSPATAKSAAGSLLASKAASGTPLAVHIHEYSRGQGSSDIRNFSLQTDGAGVCGLQSLHLAIAVDAVNTALQHQLKFQWLLCAHQRKARDSRCSIAAHQVFWNDARDVLQTQLRHFQVFASRCMNLRLDTGLPLRATRRTRSQDLTQAAVQVCICVWSFCCSLAALLWVSQFTGAHTPAAGCLFAQELMQHSL